MYTVSFSSEAIYAFYKDKITDALNSKGLGVESVIFDDNQKQVTLPYSRSELKMFFKRDADLGFLSEINSLSPMDSKTPEGISIGRDTDLRTELEPIIISAQNDFNTWKKSRVTSPPYANPKTNVALVRSSLDQDGGALVIGEIHTHQSPQFLLQDDEVMGEIKKQNGVLLLEMFPKKYTDMTNEWIKSPPDTPMPRKLELFAEGIDQNYGLSPNGYIKTLQNAKKHGVELQFFEGEDTTLLWYSGLNSKDLPSGSTDEHSEDILGTMRGRLMNHSAASVGKELQRQGKKLVYKIGDSHACNFHSSFSGVAEAVGGVSVFYRDNGNRLDFLSDGQSDWHQSTSSNIIITDNPNTRSRSVDAKRGLGQFPRGHHIGLNIAAEKWTERFSRSPAVR